MEVLKVFLIFPAIFICLLVIGLITDNISKISGFAGEALGCFAFFVLKILMLFRVMLMGFISVFVPVMLWNYLVEPVDEKKYTWLEPFAAVVGLIMFVLIFRWLCKRYGGCREFFVGD